MKQDFECKLCGFEPENFCEFRERSYFRCENCFSIFMHPEHYPSYEEEKMRYQLHNNDVTDTGYQKFVMPIVNAVKKRFTHKHKGLDFGAGTGPVASKLLQDEHYNIALYDPIFHNYPEKLNSSYDYIVCCEVIEHFHTPRKEFKLLKSLLKSRGVLYCMTEIYNENIDFLNWYYKNDETHVFFYQKSTLEWIMRNFGFSNVNVKGRFIQFFA
jgi:SAM-dependent methyltransferase